MKTKKDKIKDDKTTRDDLVRAICLYTNDSIGKVLPWVKDYLKNK
jgi:hypothetical protein